MQYWKIIQARETTEHQYVRPDYLCCGVGSESTEMKQKNKLLLSWVQKCRVVAEGTKVQLAIFYGIQ